ncbi:adenine phosphoribosyltransferase [Mycetocola reblochoni]|uniref:Adenine phosphoribosyltransferase n=2 Tax=Mycetocola reblochoni TaxID=331618 RepID=A0A1R4K8V4_9MICO|nr:adenine phosphoribosyltransferase [Mycetocola reblochoni]RLP68095.1 adenine phosphoribosyltransferase [Mycetocola reblochoni]SJN40719.1 Adenine phosphoribosyltransferase [Mycetocola reblochoni REB411]
MSAASDAVHRLSVHVRDFPAPGILFRDLTPVFEDVEAFRAVTDELASPFEGAFDAVLGIESRGFLLAAAIGVRRGVPVLVARKRGKLPPPVLSEEYSLEYGSAVLEMAPRRLDESTRVLVVDDVLATGGSAAATARLVARAGYRLAGVSVIVELGGLGGRDALGDIRMHSTLVD